MNTRTYGASAFLIGMIIVSAAQGQDLRTANGRSLFADQKASSVGDLITVLVVESASASNDAKSSSSRSSDLSLSASGNVNAKPLPNASLSLGTSNAFAGEGATQSRGSVRATISARIDSVLPNGFLSISGSRTISINGEDQIIRIAGLVRTSDISSDNSVYSTNIADAVIVFEGSGMIDRSQSPGLFTRLFHWIF